MNRYKYRKQSVKEKKFDILSLEVECRLVSVIVFKSIFFIYVKPN